MCSSLPLPIPTSTTTAAALLILASCSSTPKLLPGVLAQQGPRPAHQLVREGPFRVRLHYEDGYNWQSDNLQFGTSYCWSCSGTGADLGSSTTQATKLLDDGEEDGGEVNNKQCQKGDTVWIAPCDISDPKQLFQYERIDNLLQVDGHTSTVGLFKMAGTDLCLTDDRAQNCGFDKSEEEYEEEKCYTLQKCATVRYASKTERAGGGGGGDSSIISAATAEEEDPYSILPSIASRQLFVGFDPARDLFEVHPFSLTGYTATQGISYRKCGTYKSTNRTNFICISLYSHSVSFNANSLFLNHICRSEQPSSPQAPRTHLRSGMRRGPPHRLELLEDMGRELHVLRAVSHVRGEVPRS